MLMIWRAVNDRHWPSLICPCIVSSAVWQSGVPGVIAWVSHRRAGSGRSAIAAGSNLDGFAVPVASRSQSCWMGLASCGTVIGAVMAACHTVA